MSSSTGFALEPDFVPGPFDVICGRGKSCYAHEGNLKLCDIVRQHVKEYSLAKSKEEKSAIVSAIAAEIHRRSPNGGFVKKEAEGWYEVGAFLAREKISQVFRNILQDQYKSSTRMRRKIRQERREMLRNGGESSSSSAIATTIEISPAMDRRRNDTYQVDRSVNVAPTVPVVASAPIVSAHTDTRVHPIVVPIYSATSVASYGRPIDNHSGFQPNPMRERPPHNGGAMAVLMPRHESHTAPDDGEKRPIDHRHGFQPNPLSERPPHSGGAMSVVIPHHKSSARPDEGEKRLVDNRNGFQSNPPHSGGAMFPLIPRHESYARPDDGDMRPIDYRSGLHANPLKERPPQSGGAVSVLIPHRESHARPDDGEKRMTGNAKRPNNHAAKSSNSRPRGGTSTMDDQNRGLLMLHEAAKRLQPMQLPASSMTSVVADEKHQQQQHRQRQLHTLHIANTPLTNVDPKPAARLWAPSRQRMIWSEP